MPKIIEFLDYKPNQEDVLTLEQKIKEYRLLNGLSYKKLGLILSVDASTVSAWESGKSYPQPNTEKKLMQLLTL